MGQVRVLIVDDAVVVRRMLSDIISSDTELVVVGTAANGKIALTKLPELTPDVIILDLDMPEMGGIETLRRIKKTHPRLPVIAFSTLTHRGAQATLEALSRGAADYVTKPSSLGGGKSAISTIRDELIPKIKAFARPQMRRAALGASPGPAQTAPPRPRAAPPAGLSPKRAAPIRILAIGTSTGGPNALTQLLGMLPKPFPIPIVVVQHMPPIFTNILAERLTANTGHRVYECASGTVIEPGVVWVAPGDFHMVVTKAPSGSRLQTHQGEPENSCRPAVDPLFRSVADVYGPNVLAVILTGMGSDGLKGCHKIREAGGQILVQDEASSVVWGMPGYVANAGLADKVLPIDAMAEEIKLRVSATRMVRRDTGITSQGR